MKNSSEPTLQSSLRSANFILLVLGQGISLFGNTMLRFAMSMWVLDETASSTTFATVLAISVIPTILISPFGGVMADRVSKRAMMVALDIISGIVTLLTTVFFALSGFNILAIAIMQVVLAVLDAMETPVVQSALPQIIGRESSTDLRMRRGHHQPSAAAQPITPEFPRWRDVRAGRHSTDDAHHRSMSYVGSHG